jgi:hypothetical protein
MKTQYQPRRGPHSDGSDCDRSQAYFLGDEDGGPPSTLPMPPMPPMPRVLTPAQQSGGHSVSFPGTTLRLCCVS